MHPIPLSITIGGALIYAIVPAVIVVVGGFLSHHAARWVAKHYPDSEAARRRRDETQAAQTWGELYDDLSRRVAALEAGREESSGDHTALANVAVKLDRIERSLRRHNLTDSTRPGQMPR